MRASNETACVNQMPVTVTHSCWTFLRFFSNYRYIMHIPWHNTKTCEHVTCLAVSYILFKDAYKFITESAHNLSHYVKEYNRF